MKDGQAVNQMSDGQPEGVSQIADGQPQASQTEHATVYAPAVTQISDGQPQVPPIIPQIGNGEPKVTQIGDGQPQAPSVVSQINDGQPQAPEVTQISDGQPQAPPAVSQISDGQPQAPEATQISEGQPQGSNMKTCALGYLTLTLENGTLVDQDGRYGYIAEGNNQFQFDNPVQAGGYGQYDFSICENGTVAWNGSTDWWKCDSGAGFYNLYNAEVSPDACQPCKFLAVACT